MNIENQNFQFIDPGELVDNELKLVLVETTPGDPAREWLPSYVFDMQVNNSKVGGINIRIGNTPWVVKYAGHIGYIVDQEYRGNHYAERACRLIFPLAKDHGLTNIWIMCNPDNLPSRRTCERLGGILVEIVALPEDSDMYQVGEKESCRYRIDLGE